ncbi:terpene synthase family protein [Streptomyces sp. NPDC005808]|uniref:terpene synthase family protein n=1 Tax=Streptomyces sp. NPDC005808 TaxID=3364734 RepID=UPI003689485C
MDILAHCNDVHGVEREEARGDIPNLVLVLEAASGRSHEQVIDGIRHGVGRLAEEFQRLAAGTPAVCERLSCDPYERVSTERHLRPRCPGSGSRSRCNVRGRELGMM